MTVLTVHDIFPSMYIPEYVEDFYHYSYPNQRQTEENLVEFLTRKVCDKQSTNDFRDFQKLKFCHYHSNRRQAIYKMGYLYWLSLPSSEGAGKGMVLAATTDKQRVTGKKTLVKLGRLLLKMYPWLQPKEIEAVVDSYKEEFGPRHFTVHRSHEIAKICRKSLARTQNFATTTFKKSLSNSCMRHAFNQTVHPMKAYESGEFEVIYLLDGNKKLAARTILRISNGTYAPIYCVCNQAYDQLKEYLRGQGYESLENNPRGWVGAKLLLLETWVESGEDDEGYETGRHESYAVPYVDCIPCAYNPIVDDYIVIADWEDYDGEDYNEREPTKGRYVSLKTADGYCDG
jgi:hypothetical protein